MESPKAPIPALHGDFKSVLARLGEGLSLQMGSVSDNFSRFLLLVAASYFETRLTYEVTKFAAKVTSESHVLTHLVRNKAVERQYHTWFSWKNWEKSGGNEFFVLFGTEFRDHMKEKLRACPEMKKAIRAFMEIGNERNRLAHEGIVGCSFEKTSDEVYATYERALRFVEWFPVALAEFAENPPPPAE